MRDRRALRSWVPAIATALAVLAAPVSARAPMGTAFTYQGYLTSGGAPVNDTADFRCSLWDASTEGSQIGSTVAVDAVSVVDGTFVIKIDFGDGAFVGEARWLEIEVRSPAGGGAYTTLSPRQELTPAPQALFAEAADALTMPFEASGDSPDPLLSVSNSGEGVAAVFETAGTGGALFAFTDGAIGQPAHFAIHNAANTNVVLSALQVGLGSAGLFMQDNAASTSAGVEVWTMSGAGKSVHAHTDGTGPAGWFEVSQAANVSAALEAKNFGTGPAARLTVANVNTWVPALDVTTSGTGPAARFNTFNSGANNPTVDVISSSMSSPAVEVSMQNAGSTQSALEVSHDGTGWAGHFDGDKGVWISVPPNATALNCGGRLGIRIGSSPTEDLDVAGTARLRGIPPGTGTTVVVDGSGVLWRQTSSRRYKHDIEPLAVEPGRVERLRPVRFHWNGTGEEDIGLIAEDVDAIIPGLVIHDRDGRPEGVKYDRIGVYLLEVVRSQAARIAQLEQKVSALTEQTSKQSAAPREAPASGAREEASAHQDAASAHQEAASAQHDRSGGVR